MILRAFSAIGASLYCRASLTQCGAHAVVRFSHLAIALAALDLGAAAFAQTPEPRAVFTAACAACHGDDGRGRGASELGFETPLPDFTDCDFAAREMNADWHTIVHRGGIGSFELDRHGVEERLRCGALSALDHPGGEPSGAAVARARDALGPLGAV